MAIFIEGEPPAWQVVATKDGPRIESLRALGLTTLSHPHVVFTVSSYLRGGNRFDIDNLAKLVLDEVAREAESIWVEVLLGGEPGTLIADRQPDRAFRPAVTIRIEEPRHKSVAGVGILEIADHDPLGTEEHLGLELNFDNEGTVIGNFGFEGPIKPLIDGLQPILGGPINSPHDHRIKELRVSRSHHPGGHGVVAKLWRLPAR